MEDNLLKNYLDQIGREQLLSASEEQELSVRIKAGDGRALNRLVEANLRFVVKIAAQYNGKGLSLDDLISEGNIGLMQAAARFDAERGTPFVKFAVVFIRRSIEKALEEQLSQYKIPKDANLSGQKNSRALSVDAPLGKRSNMSLLSVLVNKNSPMADERIYNSAVESAIEFAVDALPIRECEVINAYFGIGREHETLAEIAERMGLKRERVRQIRNRAVRRLRKSFRHHLLLVKGVER